MSTHPSGARRHVRIQADQIRSDELLSRDGHLLIRHAGRCYQLRRTAAGKLILTCEPGFVPAR